MRQKLSKKPCGYEGCQELAGAYNMTPYCRQHFRKTIKCEYGPECPNMVSEWSRSRMCQDHKGYFQKLQRIERHARFADD